MLFRSLFLVSLFSLQSLASPVDKRQVYITTLYDTEITYFTTYIENGQAIPSGAIPLDDFLSQYGDIVQTAAESDTTVTYTNYHTVTVTVPPAVGPIPAATAGLSPDAAPPVAAAVTSAPAVTPNAELITSIPDPTPVVSPVDPTPVVSPIETTPIADSPAGSPAAVEKIPSPSTSISSPPAAVPVADPSTTASAAAADTTAAAAGTTYTGQGTFYSTGLGSCGITNTDTDYICAISHILYDSQGTPNPNNNPFCGRKLTATYQGKSVTVTVTDRCEGCAEYDLDFSPSAFDQLADPSAGRISGVEWSFIS